MSVPLCETLHGDQGSLTSLTADTQEGTDEAGVDFGCGDLSGVELNCLSGNKRRQRGITSGCCCGSSTSVRHTPACMQLSQGTERVQESKPRTTNRLGRRQHGRTRVFSSSHRGHFQHPHSIALEVTSLPTSELNASSPRKLRILQQAVQLDPGAHEMILSPSPRPRAPRPTSTQRHSAFAYIARFGKTQRTLFFAGRFPELTCESLTHPHRQTYLAWLHVTQENFTNFQNVTPGRAGGRESYNW